MFNLFKHFYKSKRKLRRNVAYIKKDVLGTNVRHKKDYKWKKKQVNPYKQQQDRFTTKSKALLLFGIICILACIGIWIFHPFFHINQIHISGNDRIATQELHKTVAATIDNTFAFVIPTNSYLFVNIPEIEQILKEKYPLKSVRIEKSFPRTLTVDIQEKISYLIVDDTKTYSLYDLDGAKVKILQNVGQGEWKIQYETITLTTTTVNQNNEEIVEEIVEEREVGRIHQPDTLGIRRAYDNYPIVLLSDTSQLYTREQADYIISWYEEFNTKKTDGGGIRYFKILNTTDFDIITDMGYIIHANTKQPVSYQMKILSEVLDRDSATEYIDVRFSNRAFWK